MLYSIPLCWIFLSLDTELHFNPTQVGLYWQHRRDLSISHLRIISKLLSRVILRRLLDISTSLACSPPIAMARCYRISWWHSTVATWQCWTSVCCVRHRRSPHPTAPSLCILSYGISGAALSWISTYLTDRQQCVWHAQMQSTHECIEFGVPQAVLGPLLFVKITGCHLRVLSSIARLWLCSKIGGRRVSHDLPF